MHATSKLIIPAKSAQDSPYVPKIRIFLRPSSSLDKSSDMGSSLGPDCLMTDVSQQNHSEESQVEQIIKTQDSGAAPLSIEHKQSDKSNKPLQEQVRTGRKRKLGGSLDNIDFERRDSVLTKVNLKKIINMDTFESLPVESRRNLLSLLPVHDQHPPPDVTMPPGGTDYWIHPTALNNEFLTKALQDYSTRQMNGDFSPRLNSRTGLRKSVGNRQRYSSPATSPLNAPPLVSTPMFQSPIISTKEDPPEHHASLNTNNTSIKTVGSDFSSRTSALQTALTKEEPVEPRTEAMHANKESQETLTTKLESKDSESGSQSACPHFAPTTTSFTTTTSSTHSTSSDTSNISSSSPSHGTSSNPPSNGLSPSNNITTLTTNMVNQSKVEEINRPALRPSSGLPEQFSGQRRLNMPKLESTLLLQGGIKPHQEYALNSSPRKLPLTTAGRRPLQTVNDPPSSNRPPLVVDSSTPSTKHVPTIAMPPPRETRTLANLRESFRQRVRMFKQQQQQQQSRSLQIPPVSLSTVQTQQDQSNSGTNIPGEFYPSHSASTTPNIVQPSSSTAKILAPRMIKSTAVIIQPTGNSMSAPATPQHGSTGSSGLAGVPIPAILANFKEARVVVTPSRSGSSTSSNDGAPEVSEHSSEQDGQVLQHQATHQQTISPKQTMPQHHQPVVAVTTGGPATTTRAYFVDGNNLTETLALLQSINPGATVTQQQFLLIPGTDKSHAILCRTPIAIQPKQATIAPTSATQPQPQTAQVRRRPSGSAQTVAPNVCPQQVAATSPVRPLILPVSRPQEQQQQTPQVPPGLYREILPNVNNSGSNIQRFQTTPIQVQQQQQSQLRPAPAYFSLVTSSNIAQSGGMNAPSNVNSVTTTAPGSASSISNALSSNGNTNYSNPPTSFLPPPAPPAPHS